MTNHLLQHYSLLPIQVLSNYMIVQPSGSSYRLWLCSVCMNIICIHTMILL